MLLRYVTLRFLIWCIGTNVSNESAVTVQGRRVSREGKFVCLQGGGWWYTGRMAASAVDVRSMVDEGRKGK